MKLSGDMQGADVFDEREVALQPSELQLFT
jgi:hypothetical protein